MSSTSLPTTVSVTKPDRSMIVDWPPDHSLCLAEGADAGAGRAVLWAFRLASFLAVILHRCEDPLLRGVLLREALAGLRGGRTWLMSPSRRSVGGSTTGSTEAEGGQPVGDASKTSSGGARSKVGDHGIGGRRTVRLILALQMADQGRGSDQTGVVVDNRVRDDGGGTHIETRWVSCLDRSVPRGHARLLAPAKPELRRFLRWSETTGGDGRADPEPRISCSRHPRSRDRSGPTHRRGRRTTYYRHHSTVELVDRADSAGLVSRHRDRRPPSRPPQSTDDGASALGPLRPPPRGKLDRLALQLPAVWNGLLPPHPPWPLPAPRPETPPQR